MNRNCLFNKAIALLLCAVMLVGFLPSVAFGAAAEEWKPSENEGPLDIFETTEAPTEPVGSKGNPEPITESATATLAADSDGYYYVYKNESSGTLNINFGGDYGYKFTVSKNGEVVASGMDANNFAYNYTLPEWPESNVNGYAYEAGTELIIWVNTYNVATIETTNEDGSVASTEYEEQYPEGSVTVTVEFTYPEGTQQNPITLGADEDNSAVIEAGATKYFEYSAYSNGYLTIDFKGEGASCVLSVDGVAQDSSAVNNVKYTSGQVYAFAVSAEAETNVNFVVTFVNGWGDETSPFLMTKMDFTVTIPAGETYWYQGNLTGMNLTVTGEQGVLTYNSAQSDITSDGTTVMITTGDFFNKPMFAVGNDSDADVTYHIVASYPAGHYTNPDKAVLGDNSVTLATPSDQGYYFDYVAEKDGNLIFTITSESNWSHNVSVGSYGEYGFEASIYGENRLYAEDPAVKTLTLPVTAGQIVQIVVNAVEAEQMSYTWEGVTEYYYNTTPIAGTVSFNLAYEKDEPEQPTVRLRMSGANMSFESSLTLMVKVISEVYDYYDDLYINFTTYDAKTGEKTSVDIDEAVWDGSAWYFNFAGISPRRMNDNIEVTLHGTYDGVEYTQLVNYSPATYCYNKLGSSTNQKFLTVLVNLLNYATKHQEYADYNIENKANASLTPEQAAYGTSGSLTYGNPLNLKYNVLDGASVSFKGANLYFLNSVQVYYKFSLPAGADPELYSVRLSLVDGSQNWEVAGDKFEPVENAANQYCIYFEGLTARQMREAVLATVYMGETPVSNTVLYGIESYCNNKFATTSAELQVLLEAMMHYGDACLAYSKG